MSNLRDLLPITAPSTAYKQQVISVYNTNIDSVQNGGACCCWIVPVGTTWAVFETWSGGGDGAGACCCMGPYWGPGGGNYAKKYLPVTTGCYFILCGGGSGCCAQQCCGTCGLSSFVLCQNSTNVAYSCGGYMGCVLCFRTYMGCTGICIPSCSYGCYSLNYDITMPSVSSPNKVSNYCWSNQWEWSHGVSKYGNYNRQGMDYCLTSLTIQGRSMMCGAKWPGGAGNSATACGGGCCWGGWGAGGLAMVTYG